MSVFGRALKWLSATPASESKATSILPASAFTSASAGQGIEAPTDSATYLQLYGSSGWLQIAVKKVAMKCAEAQLVLLDNDKEVEQHIFLDTLKHPNAGMSQKQMFWLLYQQLQLAGEHFWYVVDNGVGGVGMILPLSPTRMTVVPGTTEVVQGYIYDTGRERVAFAPEEVVHFMYPNPDPDNMLRGSSPVSTLAYALATNQNAQLWNHQFFKNSAKPEGYLQTDLELDEIEAERLRRRWERLHQGSDNWRKTAVASHGLRYQRTTIGHAEMDFLAQLDNTRDFILQAIGVPRSIAGIEKDVNKANAYQDELNFALYTIQPTLELVSDTMNSFLLPRWGDALTCKFENFIPRNEELILKKNYTYLKTSVITINEVRTKDLGLEPVPWGDEPVAVANETQPGGSPTHDGLAPPQDGTEQGTQPGVSSDTATSFDDEYMKFFSSMEAADD